ncbi:MAG: hypothetical protein ACI8WB_003962 [Phenylobacterium sp.]|jgi:hypothetical protein
MRYATQINCLLLLLSGLFTTGCAHKQLIDAGEDHNRQGRYEQAVDQYQQALDLKPDDHATRQKLANAQQELDIWLDDVHTQANAAKRQGLDGRALLLFSKVAQLRRDQAAISQYKQLHQQLASQYRYKIAIDAPATLGANLARTLPDVQVIAKTPSHNNTYNNTNNNTNPDNQFSVKISVDKPVFATSSKTLEKMQQYVSGVTAVPNPDYLHLQDDIAKQRQHIDQLSVQLDHEHEAVNNRARELNLWQKDLEIARLRVQQAPANSTQASRLQQEVNRVQQELNRVQQYYNRETKALDKTAAKLHHSKDGLIEQLNELSYLPPTRKEDILSDYFYPVEEVTRSASAKVTIRFNRQGAKSKNVTVSDSDESHDEQPLIKLAYNSIELISDKALGKNYYHKAREQAEQAIKRHALDYRDGLKNKANQMAGIDDKMEAWVHYGISSEKAIDSHTSQRMTSQLKQEFGVAGEFPINDLLHLFR